MKLPLHGWAPVLAAWLLAAPPSPGSPVVRGQILDARDARPITGAHLIWPGNQPAGSTGDDGRFVLEIPPGTDHLLVTHIAYASRSLPLPAMGDTMRIRLEPRLLSLETLVVMGPAPGAEESRFQQERQRAFTTEQALEQVEGISLIRRGAFAPDPVIRGLSASRLQLRVDGMVVHGACTDRMDPVTSYLDLEAVDRAIVRQGGFDSRLGSSMGGSIELHHLPAHFSPEPLLRHRLSLGAADALNRAGSSLAVELSRPRSALRVHSSFEEAGNYLSPEGEEPHSGHRRVDAYASLRLRPSTRSELDLLLQGDDGWDIGYAALPMDVGHARYRAAVLSGRHALPNALPATLEWKLYHNRVDHWMDDSGRDELLMGMHMDMPGHTRSSGASLQAMGAAGGARQLTLRLEVLNTHAHADMLMRPADATPMFLLTWPDVRNQSVALWAELLQVRGTLRASINGRLELARMEALNSQGVRQLQLSQPGAPSRRSDCPASLGLVLDWEVQPTLETGLSLGWSQRAPSTTEAFGYYLYVASDGYLHSGDPLLKPEQSVQLEWRTAWKPGPLDIRLTAWRSEMLNWITGLPDPGEVPVPFARGWKRSANSGRAHLQGVDLHLRRELLAHWNLQGSGTLQRGWRDEDGDPLPDMTPLSGRISLNHERTRWSWLLELRGAGARDHPSRLGQEDPRPGFAVLQSRVDLKASSRLHLSLAVDNLLDRRYQEATDWGSALRPGRTLHIRLEYSGSSTL